MPWKETCAMEQKRAFINEYLQGVDNFKKHCERYEISEKTGHKWKNRFLEGGFAGLLDQSKAPRNSPNQLDEDAVIRLIKLRTAHPTWGPKKLAVLYGKAYPGSPVPSESSIYRVLGKANLIEKRRLRKVSTSAAHLRNRIVAHEPNDVWTVDFKGWWVSDGERCLPLTIRDLKSKYIIDVRLMKDMTATGVKAVFEKAFKKYGLPKVIRSDNGSPFASSQGYLGLTTLSAWWMFLGILPDRTDPGCPTQNGSHERMHADLSRDIQAKIPGGVVANQEAIDLWIQEYNNVRPHETLEMKTPSDVYCNSSITYKGTPDDLEYPIGFRTRKIDSRGYVKIDGARVIVSQSLFGFTVGLQPKNYKEYLMWFSEFPIGVLDTAISCLNPIDVIK
jgi:transposase InsO family protein